MPEVAVTDLQAATAALQAATAQVRTDHKAMSEWATTQADFVTVKDESGLDVQVPSLDYLNRQFSILETDVRSLLGEARAPQLSDYYRERSLMLAQVAASGALVKEVNRDWGTGTTPNLVTMPDAPEFVIAGLSMVVRNEFRFAPAPDGRDTFNTGTGERLRHSSADAAFDAEAVGGGTVEVVKARKDVFATEVFLELITPAHPHIYPGGDIHSTASTMDGFATEDSTRPDSYHAMYDGEVLPAKPKGVNLFAIPAAQLVVHLQAKANRLYQLNDYTFAQVRRRNRTIAGAGNGDWMNVDSTKTYLSFGSSAWNAIVAVQGINDEPWGGASINTRQAASYHYYHHSKGQQPGIFQTDASGNNNDGVNGECFLIVHGTWARLNQGAYHPSHNPLGTAMMGSATAGQDHYTVAWHASNAKQPASTRECFTSARTTTATSGAIAGGSGWSGRPDDRFYDAIYPGGLGGITDLRLEARQQTQADHSRVDALVKSGQYRGLETVKRTKVESITAGSGGYWNQFTLANGATTAGLRVGSRVWVQYQNDLNHFVESTVASIVNSTTFTTAANIGYAANALLVVERDTDLSVSGEFTWQTVIGNPARIAACADLANGWLGDWCPIIPDGTGKAFPLQRELPVGYTLASASVVLTDDDGATYSAYALGSYTGSWNNTTKVAMSLSLPSSRVCMVTFSTWANMTEPCANAAPRDAYAGLSDVWAGAANQSYRGALLSESLIGKVITNSGNNFPSRKHYALTEYYINDADDALHAHPSYAPAHRPVALGAPDNNSPAVKALRYNHVADGQAVNCYAFAELGYDGDWGDSGIMPIVSNDGTWVDDNGHTRKAGTHKLALPFGWV